MKIAIQGHPTRGKEVIQILESLGGINMEGLTGTYKTFYYINHRNKISDTRKSSLISTHKCYTLEEFEKEFPFKVGDKVVCKASKQTLHTIVGISSDSCACMQYEIKEDKTGIITHCPTNLLIKYKEMKEERNVTLTLDKAKEWYKKGGELKEVALQAFTEEELTKAKLPKTWEEFCTNYPKRSGEAYINHASHICVYSSENFRQINMDKNICPSRESAKAHLAMIQLEQLRDCWWDGWKPIWDISEKWCIRSWGNELCVGITTNISRFLTFPTKEMAEEFLECFRDLIELAKYLI